MPTARDMRAAAWKRMKEGGLLPLLAGFALAFLLSSLADNLLAWYGAQRGWIEQVPALQVLDEVGLALAPEHKKILESITIPKVTPAYRLATILFSTAWASGILAYGCAVLAISAMRGGAQAFQVFSGFRWPLLPRTVAISILRIVIVMLGLLLFIFPGILAIYSYRMAYMLLADNPDWSPIRALQESRKLMQGNRWRLFCLDASFCGWFLLMLVTGGLAGIFVLPYFETANAAFYEDLLDRAGR
jgi:hypothetical protein